MIRALFVAFFISVALPSMAVGAAVGDLKLDDKIHSMKKAGVGPVIFPHARHEKLYGCDHCHPRIFKKKRGTSGITMKFNMDGKFCGSPNCHNSTKAFPLYQCTKCHTHVEGAAK